MNGIRVLMSEVTGIYSGGMAMTGQRKRLTGYMLLGAVAAGPDANWFFKFTGSQATVEANREAFALRTRSISSIIREQGQDPDEVWEEIARDEQRMTDLGVTPPATTEVATDGNPEDEEPDGDDATA